MNLDVDKLLDRTVTVFHRIDARKAGAKADEWTATIIQPASWSETGDRTQDADGTVHIARRVRVQLPATSAEFFPPEEWAKGTGYTLETGDYACLGAANLAGTDKAAMLAAIEGKPNCQLVLVRDCRNNGAAEAPASGCMKYVSMVYAEGK